MEAVWNNLCPDKVIAQYPAIACDDELTFCPKQQMAYQRDMSKSVAYDKDYFEKYIRYEGTELANAINAARVGLAEKYCKNILDIGIGSGEFIKSCSVKVHGFDINPYGIKWLKDRNLFFDPTQQDPKDFDGVTMWDTLEHMKTPSDFLDLFPVGVHVFLAIPLFTAFHTPNEICGALRLNKHYRPNEHYYYFNRKSLLGFMVDCGFGLLEENTKEIEAGREDIYSFAFKKVRPGLQLACQAAA